MTEYYTVAEAQALGIFGDGSRTSTKETPGERAANAEIKRLKAWLKLVRALLGDGHEVRLEYRFHPKRKWRFDLCLLDLKLALEIDGGKWINGAHHRAKGRQNDNEKDSEAGLLGFRVLRCDWEHVKNGDALALLRRYADQGNK